MLLIAFEFPKVKKDACWRRREVVEISIGESGRHCRRLSWSEERRRRGMLVARLWVRRRRVRREWRVMSVAGVRISGVVGGKVE